MAYVTFDTPFTFSDRAVQQIITRSANLPNGKILDTHTGASNTLTDIAQWFVQYYGGSDNFLNSLKAWHKAGKMLTPKQSAAALNAMLRTYKAQQAITVNLDAIAHTHAVDTSDYVPTTEEYPDPPAPASPVTPTVLDGIYTVVLDEVGTYRTLQLITANTSTRVKFNLPEGAQIAHYLSGSDNTEDYTGFAFIEGKVSRVWARFKTDTHLSRALDVLLHSSRDRQIDYGQAYALESNRCWRCNRPLTVPASINRGLGPICAEKI